MRRGISEWGQKGSVCVLRELALTRTHGLCRGRRQRPDRGRVRERGINGMNGQESGCSDTPDPSFFIQVIVERGFRLGVGARGSDSLVDRYP